MRLVLVSNTMHTGTQPILFFRGLETGIRDIVSHVMRNNEGVYFVFSSPYSKDQ